MSRRESRPRAHTCERAADTSRPRSVRTWRMHTPLGRGLTRAKKLGADFYLAVGGHARRVHRQRDLGIVEAAAVVEGESLLLDRRLNGRPAAAVTHDAARHHRGPGEG